jgi:hypothetical protein
MPITDKINVERRMVAAGAFRIIDVLFTGENENSNSRRAENELRQEK